MAAFEAAAPSVAGLGRRRAFLHEAPLALVWLAGAAIVLVRAPGPGHALVAIGELSLLSAIALWDIRTLRAPNIAVVPGLLGSLALAWAFGTDAGVQALSGAAVAFLVLALIALFGRGAMGAGDVKYGAFAGSVVGLRGLFPLFGGAFVIGGALAGVVLLLRLRTRKQSVAFTPFIALGVVAAFALVPVYLVA